MNESDLGSSAYVVLGLALQEGAITPYDLKQRIATSVGYFWPYSHPQIYAVTDKLYRLGLLSQKQQKTGRRRKLYSVTAKGRRLFEQWLLTNDESHTEIRDLALLKLYFSRYSTEQRLKEMALAQVTAHRKRRDLYQSIPQERELDEYAIKTVDLGVRFETLAVKFWQDVASDVGET